MNTKQKIQVSLAALCVAYIIFWLFIPGWDLGKILAIFLGVSFLMAIYFTYRAEKKN